MAQRGWEVLIVEDEPALRHLYATALRLAGFRTSVAEDGIDALRRVDAGPPPDVVVLDIGLPRLPGTSVADELAAHADTQEIPIVVVTGLNGVVPSERFASVLRKPIEPERVVAAVERAVGRPARRRRR